MHSETNFYEDAQKGRNALWVWGCGIVVLFVLTFLIPLWIYDGLRDLAVVKMWPSLIKILGNFGPTEEPYIVVGSELLHWLLSCITLGLGIWFAQRFLRRRPIKKIITSAPAFRWKRLWAGCLVYTVIFIIFWSVVCGFALLKPDPSLLGETGLLERLNIEKVYIDRAFWAALPIIFIFTPINAALQEIAFRGFVDQGVLKIIPHKFLAFLFSGVIFAAWHYGSRGQSFGWFGFYMGFVIFAVCMSFLSSHDNGLEAAIGVHTANNILASLVVGNPYDGFSLTYVLRDLSVPNYGGLSVFTDFCMYGTCLIVLVFWRFGLKHRDNNV